MLLFAPCRHLGAFRVGCPRAHHDAVEPEEEAADGAGWVM